MQQMANTLYETRLQGIMGVVFIILDWILVFMNSINNDVQQVRRWLYYLTIRPAARKGYGSIAYEAKPNGLLTRGP